MSVFNEELNKRKQIYTMQLITYYAVYKQNRVLALFISSARVGFSFAITIRDKNLRLML